LVPQRGASIGQSAVVNAELGVVIGLGNGVALKLRLSREVALASRVVGHNSVLQAEGDWAGSSAVHESQLSIRQLANLVEVEAAVVVLAGSVGCLALGAGGVVVAIVTVVDGASCSKGSSVVCVVVEGKVLSDGVDSVQNDHHNHKDEEDDAHDQKEARVTAGSEGQQSNQTQGGTVTSDKDRVNSS